MHTQDTDTLDGFQIDSRLSDISHDELDYFDKRMLTMLIKATEKFPNKSTFMGNDLILRKLSLKSVEENDIVNLLYRLEERKYIKVDYHRSPNSSQRWRTKRTIYLSRKTLKLLSHEK